MLLCVFTESTNFSGDEDLVVGVLDFTGVAH